MSLTVNAACGLIDLSGYTTANFTGSPLEIKPAEVKPYPNAASNQIQISNQSLKAVSIRILDVHGKTDYQCSALGSQIVTINTDGLSNGLYLSENIDAEGMVTGKSKCIVQK